MRLLVARFGARFRGRFSPRTEAVEVAIGAARADATTWSADSTTITADAS